MKKIILTFMFLFILSGCSNIKVENIKFDVEFSQLNNDNKTAKFSIFGVPSEVQFKQIETIILDSLNGQNLGNQNYLVGVYSNLQDNIGTPVFGYLEVEGGKIKENNLKNIKKEEYLK